MGVYLRFQVRVKRKDEFEEHIISLFNRFI